MQSVMDDDERAVVEEVAEKHGIFLDEALTVWEAARRYVPPTATACGNTTHFGYRCMLPKGHDGDHRRWEVPGSTYVGWPQ